MAVVFASSCHNPNKLDADWVIDIEEKMNLFQTTGDSIYIYEAEQKCDSIGDLSLSEQEQAALDMLKAQLLFSKGQIRDAFKLKEALAIKSNDSCQIYQLYTYIAFFENDSIRLDNVSKHAIGLLRQKSHDRKSETTQFQVLNDWLTIHIIHDDYSEAKAVAEHLFELTQSPVYQSEFNGFYQESRQALLKLKESYQNDSLSGK